MSENVRYSSNAANESAVRPTMRTRPKTFSKIDLKSAKADT